MTVKQYPKILSGKNAYLAKVFFKSKMKYSDIL